MGKKKRKRRILLEWVVVLAVIVCLYVLVHLGVDGHGRPRVTMTRILIAGIDNGLEMFKADFGHLPHDALEGGGETNDPRWIRRWLLGLGDDGEPDKADVWANPLWTGPYVEMGFENDLSGDDYTLADAWGNPICFEVKEPIFNRDRWDVWSLGPDGKGTRDMGDIAGETPEQRREAYEEHEEGGEKVNADNIGNWERRQRRQLGIDLRVKKACVVARGRIKSQWECRLF